MHSIFLSRILNQTRQGNKNTYNSIVSPYFIGLVHIVYWVAHRRAEQLYKVGHHVPSRMAFHLGVAIIGL